MATSNTLLSTLFSLSALVAPILAQTSTDCNPLSAICKSDPALGTTFNTTWGANSELSDDYWAITDYNGGPTFPTDNSGGAFTVTGPGIAPTLVSTWYMFWGHIEVMMRAAPGQGIISSIVLLSDDLDEIDWEVMGGNTTHVETNYYGKGNATQVNSKYYPCDDPQGGFHNYTINWSADAIDWILDGDVVRTVSFDDAVDDDGKTMFPQTPMQLKIGSWAGGDSKNAKGTIEWAGGLTDYSKGPYTMTVKEVLATDGTTNATMYQYGDMSGDWQSIDITKGVSDTAKKIHAPPPLTAQERWAKMSKGGQIAIICVVLGIAVSLMFLYIFCCIKQRRAGKRERAQEDAWWAKEQQEMAEYKRMARESHYMKKGMQVHVERVS